MNTVDTQKIRSPRSENRQELFKIVPLKVPFSIGIAPSDLCNFRCNYCNQSTPAGIKDARILPWDDFQVILKQIIDLCHGGEKTKIINLIGNGEPLLNKDLPKMVQALRDSHVSDRIEVTTNASLLTPNLSEALIEAGLTRLIVSIQGIDEAAYKRTCQYTINFNRLLENLQYFYNKRKECALFIKTVNTVLCGKEEENTFYNLFSPMCDNIYIENTMEACFDVDYNKIIGDNLGRVSRYGNKVQYRICCDSLFTSVNIQSNGDVGVCGCRYPNLMIGNVFQMPLSEIWNGDIHKKIMKLHLEGMRETITDCRDCASIREYSLPEDNLDDHLEEILERVNQLE